MAGDAIWMDILPSVKGLGPSLFATATRTAKDAGRAAGNSWSDEFQKGTSGASDRLVEDLKKASKKSADAITSQKQVIAKARAAEREATAKVIEATEKLAQARKLDDPAKVAAAEARLAAARERQGAATIKVGDSESKLAEAYRQNRSNADELAKAQGKLGSASDDAATKQGRLSKAMKGADWQAYGKAATVTTTTMAAGFGAAVKSAVTFESKMNGIQAVSGATAGEMQLISDKALQLGKDTVFSASEAGDAIEELIKAGVPLKGVIGGAADAAVSLAAASGVDMAEAATIASNAMNGYNLKADQMAKVSDLIAGAANASAIDVSEFGQSLSQVSAVANVAGLSFQDTAVAIAQLGNAGIKGSDAGTALKTMMLNLSPSTEAAAAAQEQYGLLGVNVGKARKMMQDLGIVINKTTTKKFAAPDFSSYSTMRDQLAAYYQTTQKLGKSDAMAKASKDMLRYGAANSAFFDSATGKAKDLRDVQGALAKSLKGVGNEERMKALQTMFGTDAMRAAAVLTQNGIKGYDGLSKSMAKVTAEQVAQTRMKGFAGSWEQFKGSIETLGIVIGTKFLPPLTTAADKATELVNFIGRHSTVFTVAAATVGIMAGALSAAAGAMWLFNAAQLANPTTWIIAGVVVAVAALTVGIYKLWQNWDKVTAWVKDAWGGMGDWFTSKVTDPIKRGFSSAWDGAKTKASEAWTSVTGVFTGAGTWFSTSVVQPVSGALTGMWDGMASGATSAWTAVTDAFATARGWVVDAARRTWSGVTGTFTAARDWVVKTFTPAWNTVEAIIVLPFNLARRLVQLAWNGITGTASAAWKWTNTTFKRSWNTVKSIVAKPLNDARDLIGRAWGKIDSYANSAWVWTNTTFRRMWSGAKALVVGPIHDARDLIGRAWGKIDSYANAAWTWTNTTFRRLWAGAKWLVVTPIHDARDAIGRAWGKIDSYANSAWTWTNTTFRKAWSGVKALIQGPVDSAREAVSTAMGKVKAAFSDAKEAIAKSWAGVKEVVKSPIRFVVNTVLNGGLIAGFNKVARFAKSAEIKPIQLPKGFKGGGVIPGTFHPAARDNVLALSAAGVPTARVEPGEMVTNRRSTAKYRSLLEMINADRLPGYRNGGYVWPTTTRQLSGNYSGHSGVDIPVGIGTPLFAVRDGVISYVGSGRGYGVATFLTDSAGQQWVYGHQSRPAVGAGQQVRAGQQIGLSGNTGRSTGPHLHIEAALGGRFAQAANRAYTLGLLGGSATPAGGVAGSSGMDFLGMLTKAISGPLGRLKEITGSPLGQMVGKLPGMLVGGLKSKVSGFLSQITDTVQNVGSRVDAGAVKGIVRAMATTRGWGFGSQWSALDQLISHESSWNPRADNPSSTAYGLFQLLYRPGTTIPYDQHNETLQARDGLNYIKDRYGSPANAWDFWQRHHWYDQGGWLQPGATFAQNDTGKPEAILTSPQWDAVIRLANATVDSRGDSARSKVAGGERHYHFHDTHLDASDFMRRAEQRERDTFFAEGLVYAA